MCALVAGLLSSACKNATFPANASRSSRILANRSEPRHETYWSRNSASLLSGSSTQQNESDGAFARTAVWAGRFTTVYPSCSASHCERVCHSICVIDVREAETRAGCSDACRPIAGAWASALGSTRRYACIMRAWATMMMIMEPKYTLQPIFFSLNKIFKAKARSLKIKLRMACDSYVLLDRDLVDRLNRTYNGS